MNRPPLNGPLHWMLLALTLAIAGCGDGGDGTTSAPDPDASVCDPGTLDCPCDADACDGALICLDGTCRVDPCPAGGEGCDCLADDTCDGDLTCDAGTCAAPPACPDGTLGCACDAGACADADAFCDDASATCQRIGCPMGEPGCACGPQQTCGTEPDGAPLSCVGGICAPSGCEAGADGCACVGGTDCEDGTACAQGFCMSDACVAGQAGCLCAGGTCDPGLRCRGGAICVENTGFLDGPCFDDGTCTAGNRCRGDVCVACAPGSESCTCRDGDDCNAGLGCDARGLCVDPRGLAEQAPGELRCFTPCSQGTELASGRFVACPADGLMPGCFGDTACADGQCLAPGAAAAACLTDVDCADFQTCLVGRCVSNCDTADDCVDGSICHRHVCRRTCTVADDASVCGPRKHCQLFDGDNGICRTSVPAETGPAPSVDEPFTLSADVLDLGTPDGRAVLTLTNNAPTETEFTLTRRGHIAFATDGDREEVLYTEGCEAPGCPMWWVEASVGDAAVSTDAVQRFTVDAGASIELMLDEGIGLNRPRWQGTFELATAQSGVRTVIVTRSATPTGQWTGETYSFGNFKDAGIEAWVAAKDDPAALEEVENAFLRLWGNFRQGRLSFDQFQAGLVATRTESWRSRRLAELGCDDGSICYPYDNFDGFLTYTTDPTNVPVPSGVVEMPMALNMRPAGPGEAREDCADGACFTGRIESPLALQYAGLPKIDLAFASDPAGCADRPGGECLTFVDDFVSELTVGARYHTTADDSFCDGNPLLRHARTPWLLPGFIGRSERDDDSGRRYTYNCLDVEAPLPGANPVPDGRLRYRTVELIDGALINNSTLLLIYRERLETFLWEEPNANNGIEGYGYMMLRKTDTDLPAEDFQGQRVPDRDNRDRYLRPIECTDELLGQMGITRRDFEADPAFFADEVARAVVDGVVGDIDDLSIVDPDEEAVHYLCEDTGVFDGGPGDFRMFGPDDEEPCPVGSRVTFFTLSLLDDDAPLLDNCGNRSVQECHQAWLASRPCQAQGTCGRELERWIDDGRHGIRTDPYFQCDDPNRSLCNDDRQDLTRDKVFFSANADMTVFLPIRAEVAEAFRYRTRFVNRSGISVGFVPEICTPGVDLVPYCYDPAAIEALHARVECGIELYTAHFDTLGEDARFALLTMLTENFSSAEEIDIFNQPLVRRGFEFLDAELMIMLGDEHYTRALGSRFDLAGNRVQSFEGDLFEQGGIRLSGVAGAEMHNLYAAIQYYQSTLDRFYDLGPIIAGSVKAEREQGQPSFVTPAAVESYFGRLIRASTQKARAWADISERYQNFGRPDLARRVIERSYTASYLESMILTRLMQEIVEISLPEEIAQIQQQIETGQRTYRVALAIMRQHYGDITDDVNYFGFAPDFIPFPALEGLRDSSFEVARQRAVDRVLLAEGAETTALEANKSFNVDTASFQNELARIENTYDAQLADLCGTFEVDGRIFPATTRYAALSPETLAVGDPCGLVGNGQINQSMIEFDVSITEMRRVRQSIANVQEEARIEEQRWNAACGEQDAFARLNFRIRGEINDVQHEIDRTRGVLANIDRTFNEAAQLAQLMKCSLIVGFSNGGDCIGAIAASTALSVAFAAYEISRVGLDLTINDLEADIRDDEREIERARDDLACDLTAIDGEARVKTILLRSSELELEALKAEYQMNQALSEIQQRRNQATRLQQEQAETEELTINVEAARNNPNVRIYRNDAILNADATFYSALREVYKATRVFEYYTSQSYGPMEQLFLTRMVARGDYNLRLYLIELEDAFRDFEDDYGLPSRRLEIISLKDDILAIPRIDVEGSGAALTEAERTRRFRAALTDPRRLDRNGYLTIPFSTSDRTLSPLTRNHKIAHVEAEIIGGGQGDLLARIYLRMAGTSRVSALGSDQPIFYTFPERLAVLNPFFEGSKPIHIDQDIYRNRSLFDRPLVNSRWEFVLNMLDEEVNQDMDLRGLDDIRLYVYYNDFTEF